MRSKVAVAVVCGGLSGCVLAGQEAAEKGKEAMIGKTRAQVLSCAGLPNGSYRDGATEYFAYAATGLYRSGGSATYLGGGAFVYSGSSGQAQCIVTMTLQGGRVTAMSYRSSGGALIAPDEACGYVVKACL